MTSKDVSVAESTRWVRNSPKIALGLIFRDHDITSDAHDVLLSILGIL